MTVPLFGSRDPLRGLDAHLLRGFEPAGEDAARAREDGPCAPLCHGCGLPGVAPLDVFCAPCRSAYNAEQVAA